MSNMSYCRFENTFSDFEDCVQELLDPSTGLSETEREFAEKLIMKSLELSLEVANFAENLPNLSDYDPNNPLPIVRKFLSR